MLLARLNIPIMGVNALTQRLVPPPKYMVDRLLPCRDPAADAGSRSCSSSSAAPDGAAELDRDEALEQLIANTEDAYGFPPFRSARPVHRDRRARTTPSCAARSGRSWPSCAGAASGCRRHRLDTTSAGPTRSRALLGGPRASDQRAADARRDGARSGGTAVSIVRISPPAIDGGACRPSRRRASRPVACRRLAARRRGRPTAAAQRLAWAAPDPSLSSARRSCGSGSSTPSGSTATRRCTPGRPRRSPATRADVGALPDLPGPPAAVPVAAVGDLPARRGDVAGAAARGRARRRRPCWSSTCSAGCSTAAGPGWSRRCCWR